MRILFPLMFAVAALTFGQEQPRELTIDDSNCRKGISPSGRQMSYASCMVMERGFAAVRRDRARRAASPGALSGLGPGGH